MARSHVEEVDYHDFKRELKKAGQSGHRIETTDKKAWTAYIREHRVLEASAMSIARSKSENVRAVIINGDEPWGGFYVYSDDDQMCLKFVRESP